MYIHQVSLQSLEAIVSIVVKSAGRISELCMHVCMQIYSGSVYCTSPWTHRPIPPRLNCSPLCSITLGAMITEITPFFAHSKTLDKFLCPTPPIAFTCNGCLFFTRTTCVFLTLLPPVDLLQNQFVASAVPDASTLCSTYSHRLESLFLATPSTASVHLWYLQASLHSMIHKQTRYRITHRQVGKRTVTHANTLQQRAAHNSQ